MSNYDNKIIIITKSKLAFRSYDDNNDEEEEEDCDDDDGDEGDDDDDDDDNNNNNNNNNTILVYLRDNLTAQGPITKSQHEQKGRRHAQSTKQGNL
jgi:hypothetical protein